MCEEDNFPQDCAFEDEDEEGFSFSAFLNELPNNTVEKSIYSEVKFLKDLDATQDGAVISVKRKENTFRERFPDQDILFATAVSIEVDTKSGQWTFTSCKKLVKSGNFFENKKNLFENIRSLSCSSRNSAAFVQVCKGMNAIPGILNKKSYVYSNFPKEHLRDPECCFVNFKPRSGRGHRSKAPVFTCRNCYRRTGIPKVQPIPTTSCQAESSSLDEDSQNQMLETDRSNSPGLVQKAVGNPHIARQKEGRSDFVQAESTQGENPHGHSGPELAMDETETRAVGPLSCRVPVAKKANQGFLESFSMPKLRNNEDKRKCSLPDCRSAQLHVPLFRVPKKSFSDWAGLVSKKYGRMRHGTHNLPAFILLSCHRICALHFKKEDIIRHYSRDRNFPEVVKKTTCLRRGAELQYVTAAEVEAAEDKFEPAEKEKHLSTSDFVQAGSKQAGTPSALSEPELMMVETGKGDVDTALNEEPVAKKAKYGCKDLLHLKEERIERCSLPDCRSTGSRVPLFGVHRKSFLTWAAVINRKFGLFVLKQRHKICALHFKKEHVGFREFHDQDSGQILKINPYLTRDAELVYVTAAEVEAADDKFTPEGTEEDLNSSDFVQAKSIQDETPNALSDPEQAVVKTATEDMDKAVSEQPRLRVKHQSLQQRTFSSFVIRPNFVQAEGIQGETSHAFPEPELVIVKPEIEDMDTSMSEEFVARADDIQGETPYAFPEPELVIVKPEIEGIGTAVSEEPAAKKAEQDCQGPFYRAERRKEENNRKCSLPDCRSKASQVPLFHIAPKSFPIWAALVENKYDRLRHETPSFPNFALKPGHRICALHFKRKDLDLLNYVDTKIPEVIKKKLYMKKGAQLLYVTAAEVEAANDKFTPTETEEDTSSSDCVLAESMHGEIWHSLPEPETEDMDPLLTREPVAKKAKQSCKESLSTTKKKTDESGRKCSLPDCHSTYSHVPLFRIRQKSFSTWAGIIERKYGRLRHGTCDLPSFVLKSSHRICALHFKKEDVAFSENPDSAKVVKREIYLKKGAELMYVTAEEVEAAEDKFMPTETEKDVDTSDFVQAESIPVETLVAPCEPEFVTVLPEIGDVDTTQSEEPIVKETEQGWKDAPNLTERRIGETDRKCSLPDCGSTSSSAPLFQVSQKSFPTWASIVEKRYGELGDGTAFVLKLNHRICALHFKKDDIGFVEYRDRNSAGLVLRKTFLKEGAELLYVTAGEVEAAKFGFTPTETDNYFDASDFVKAESTSDENPCALSEPKLAVVRTEDGEPILNPSPTLSEEPIEKTAGQGLKDAPDLTEKSTDETDKKCCLPDCGSTLSHVPLFQVSRRSFSTWAGIVEKKYGELGDGTTFVLKLNHRICARHFKKDDIGFVEYRDRNSAELMLRKTFLRKGAELLYVTAGEVEAAKCGFTLTETDNYFDASGFVQAESIPGETPCALSEPKIAVVETEDVDSDTSLAGEPEPKKKKAKQGSKVHPMVPAKPGGKPCDLCDLVFTRESDLIAHEKTHVGFQCPICAKVLKNRLSLKRHKRYVHEGRLAECGVCSKQFVDNSNSLPVLSGSSRICVPCSKRWWRNGRCLVCGKMVLLHNVQSHMRLHGKIFQCHVCKDVYHSKTEILSHVCIRKTDDDCDESKFLQVFVVEEGNSEASEASDSHDNGIGVSNEPYAVFLNDEKEVSQTGDESAVVEPHAVFIKEEFNDEDLQAGDDENGIHNDFHSVFVKEEQEIDAGCELKFDLNENAA